MAFLFKRNPKTPSELIRTLNEQVIKFDHSNNDKRKLQDEISRYLNSIKIILHGDEDNDPQPDLIAQLAQEVYQTDILYNLILNLSNLEFDSRKDVQTLFSTLLRRQIGNRSPTVDYLISKPKILNLLMKGPEIPNITLITNSILRDCIKLKQLNKILLDDITIWKFFQFAQTGTFENMTDSFQTLNELITTHKKISSQWLLINSKEFIIKINKLIGSNNYVTKRQSIKLLSQLLLTRFNTQFMLIYVNDPENLKLIMILLSDKSKNLQLESFNVFKIFVANPKKSKLISEILIKNRDKLLNFLEKFNPIIDRKDDNLFNDEKEFVVQQINDLPRLIISNNNPNNIVNINNNQQ
ncbi:hypothetical protein WICMUC_000736 [Wickerhamomyces mucosus]|uniref:Mo25-like protein n=1 Tax=Wickerhamomyces mucosus TaxID=1378264 RepID=A0A9P8PY98_9ASCO|nr:hypothetical protein WICMUC_000736 [Wickerhamomyces mucosus]